MKHDLAGPCQAPLLTDLLPNPHFHHPPSSKATAPMHLLCILEIRHISLKYTTLCNVLWNYISDVELWTILFLTFSSPFSPVFWKSHASSTSSSLLLNAAKISHCSSPNFPYPAAGHLVLVLYPTNFLPSFSIWRRICLPFSLDMALCHSICPSNEIVYWLSASTLDWECPEVCYQIHTFTSEPSPGCLVLWRANNIW